MAAGNVTEGVLDGSLFIKGTGDPKLVIERVWLLLRRVQRLGVREIRGDIVLDRSAFAPTRPTPPIRWRPHPPLQRAARCAAADFQVGATYSFVPEPAARRGAGGDDRTGRHAGRAHGAACRPRPCDDWRNELKASFADPSGAFAGAYPAACGEFLWPVATPTRPATTRGLIEALWRDVGGKLSGRVLDGNARQASSPASNSNHPAGRHRARHQQIQQQRHGAAAVPDAGAAAPAGAGSHRRGGACGAAATGSRCHRQCRPGLHLDNGSGFSRDTRLSAGAAGAAAAAGLEQSVHARVAELAAPQRPGRHATTFAPRRPGPRAPEDRFLRDVVGVAGYVLSDSGRRYVLVAIIVTTPMPTPRAPRWMRWCDGACATHRRADRTWNPRNSIPNDWLGYLAASLTTLSFVPPALLTLRTRDVHGISAVHVQHLHVGVALWLAYGWRLGEWPIIIANAVTLVLAATILVTKLVVEWRSRAPPDWRRSAGNRRGCPWPGCGQSRPADCEPASSSTCRWPTARCWHCRWAPAAVV